MALVLYEGSRQLDVAWMNAAADEEHATPTPHGPQPGRFPGPEWRDNWDATGTQHFFVIPDREEDVIAPFISYNLDSPFPKLLATRGLGCTVHSRPLHACTDPSMARCPYGPGVSNSSLRTKFTWMQSIGLLNKKMMLPSRAKCSTFAPTIPTLFALPNRWDNSASPCKLKGKPCIAALPVFLVQMLMLTYAAILKGTSRQPPLDSPPAKFGS